MFRVQLSLKYITATSTRIRTPRQSRKGLSPGSRIVTAQNSLTTEDSCGARHIMIPSILSIIFVVVALCLALIVALAVRYVTTASIEMDYPEIGAMKALGLRGRQIRTVLMLHFGLLTAAGATLGRSFRWALRQSHTRFSRNERNSAGTIPISPVPIGVSFSVVCLSMITVWVATRVVTRVSPVAAARDQARPHRNRRTPRLTLPSLSKLPLGLRLAVRQVTANVGQYMALAFSCAVFAFMVLTISALALQFGQVRTVTNSLGLPRSDLVITVGNPGPSAADQVRALATNSAPTTLWNMVSSYDQLNV